MSVNSSVDTTRSPALGWPISAAADEKSTITAGSSPITNASCPAGMTWMEPGPTSTTSPLSISTRIRPDRRIPRWVTGQLVVPIRGPMSLDQRQPGWNVARTARRSPSRTMSIPARGQVPMLVGLVQGPALGALLVHRVSSPAGSCAAGYCW